MNKLILLVMLGFIGAMGCSSTSKEDRFSRFIEDIDQSIAFIDSGDDILISALDKFSDPVTDKNVIIPLLKEATVNYEKADKIIRTLDNTPDTFINIIKKILIAINDNITCVNETKAFLIKGPPAKKGINLKRGKERAEASIADACDEIIKLLNDETVNYNSNQLYLNTAKKIKDKYIKRWAFPSDEKPLE
jgi:hypothetical protein